MRRCAVLCTNRSGGVVARQLVVQRAFATNMAASKAQKPRHGLTRAQLDQFDRDGYILLENFSSLSDMRELQKAAVKVVDDFDERKHRTVFHSGPQKQRNSDEYFLTSGDQVRCFFEPNAFTDAGDLKQSKHLSINKMGHAMHELIPAFRKFSYSRAMNELVQSLGYKHPAIVQSMYIFKQPRIGAPVDAHQDSTFLYTKPQSVTGFWWAVEDATIDNGCLWAVPGSHKQGNKSRFIRNPAGPGTVFDPPQEVLSTQGGVPLPVKAGGLVVLHGDLVHYSHDNRSPKSRHAFTLHVIETGPQFDYPASNWLQRADRSPFPSMRTEA